MKFIHFGCWGRFSQGIIVLNQIQENIKDKDINFISVAGDNYYPIKPKDEEEARRGKIFKEEEFNQLFEQLCKLSQIPKDIPSLYLLLGNHDVKNQDYINFPYEDKPCTILEKTEEYLQNKREECKKIRLFKNIEYKTLEHTVIIFLDTTIFETKMTEMAEKKALKCYQQQQIFPGFNKTTIDIRDYQKSIIDKILENISDNIVNIIFVGHHPIISGRGRDDTEDKAPDYLKAFIIFFHVILSHIHETKKVYYLSADTHLYDNATISIGNRQIEQFIVGTGGAKQDLCPHEKQLTIQVDDIQCKYISHYCKVEYGYLTCEELSNRTLCFDFVECQVSKKGGKKSKKREKKVKKKREKSKKKREKSKKKERKKN